MILLPGWKLFVEFMISLWLKHFSEGNLLWSLDKLSFVFLNGEPKKEVMNLHGDNPCFFMLVWLINLGAREGDSVTVEST